jgi:hypothetical protein
MTQARAKRAAWGCRWGFEAESRPNFMKRFRTTFLSLILLLAIGAAASGTAEAGRAVNALREKGLRKQLRAQDLNPVHVNCIPDKRKGDQVFTYRCNWQAKGNWPGAIPYKCYGKADYDAVKKSWRIDPCVNKMGTQIPLASKPLERPLFGYNDDWAGHQPKLDDLARIGGGVARQNLAWSIVRREEDYQPYWDYYDTVYAKMRRLGIKPLWVLINAPCWAQPDPRKCTAGTDQMRPSAAHYDDLADFAAQAVARYPDSAGIEVWNEPNYAPFWGGRPDPDAYSEMLKVVATRLADSPVPVISGGLSPHGIRTSTDVAMDQSSFLRKMFEDGAAQMVDGIGTHPYPATKDTSQIVSQMRARLGELRDVMGEFGAADTPLWVTEVGVSTTGKDSVSEDQQAKSLVDIYNTLRRVPQIPVVVFHRFIAGDAAGGEREPGFGVFDARNKRKPAFCAVAGVLGQPCA